MFKLTLTNGDRDLDLLFKIKNTNIAKKWFDEVSKGYEFYETDRFTDWGENRYIERLNLCIDKLNSYQPLVDKKVTENSTQEDYNYLHKFFEDLRGDVTAETQWYKEAPLEIKAAVNEFNILIHNVENELRTKGKHPTISITFKNRPNCLLSEKDCQHFTYRWKSGTIYIDYCHVGKTVLEAFTDNDVITEAIRPQTHYSADFIIKFGPNTPWIYYLFRKSALTFWLWRKKLNLDKLNLGMIPVADLITEIDRKELIKFNKLKKIECIK